MIDFESYKPELINRFKENVNRVYNDIKKDLGPEFKGVYNSWTWARIFNTVVNPFFNQKDKTINKNAVNNAAERYANDTILTWESKILEKVGMLEESKVDYLDGMRFSISGTKEGNNVFIYQDMIINISSKGLLFNQFPARITMNGKAISAKKFNDFFKK